MGLVLTNRSVAELGRKFLRLAVVGSCSLFGTVESPEAIALAVLHDFRAPLSGEPFIVNTLELAAYALDGVAVEVVFRSRCEANVLSAIVEAIPVFVVYEGSRRCAEKDPVQVVECAGRSTDFRISSQIAGSSSPVDNPRPRMQKVFVGDVEENRMPFDGVFHCPKFTPITGLTQRVMAKSDGIEAVWRKHGAMT